MTIPMIIKKVNGYEKKLSVVQKRLKGSFFRTLGDSIIPSSIEEGINIVSIARDSITSDTTLTGAMIKKKERQLRSCLLYTSPSPRDVEESRMPSSA